MTPTRTKMTSGRHQGRRGCLSEGGGQVGLIATPPSGSGGSVDQSCTGNGDQGWSSDQARSARCSARGMRTSI